MQGYDVSLYGRNEKVISELDINKCITLTGAISGVGHLTEVTTDIHHSIFGSEVIMVVTTANAHGAIASVDDTLGASLISAGLAEAYTLISPTGSKTITENGTDIDVAQYATVDVNVSATPAV